MKNLNRRISLLIFSSFLLFIIWTSSGLAKTSSKIISLSPSEIHLIQNKISKKSRIETIRAGKNGDIFAAGSFQKNKKTNIFLTKIKNGNFATDFGKKGIFKIKLSKKDQIFGIDQDKNGNIFVAGYLTFKSNRIAFVIKLDETGKLDTTFGKNGFFLTKKYRNSEFHFLRVDSLNRPVMVGYFSNKSKVNGLVMRLDSSGKPDHTFANKGFFEWNHSKIDRFFSLTISHDQILVTGSTWIQNQNENCMILKLNTNGMLDNRFNHTGLIVFNSGPKQDICSAITTQNDQIYVTGFHTVASKKTNIFLGGIDQSGKPLWNQKGQLDFDYYGGIDTAHGISVFNNEIIISGEYHKFKKNSFFPDGFALLKISLESLEAKKYEFHIPNQNGPYGIHGMTIDSSGKIWLGGYIKNKFTLAGLSLLE